MTAMARRIAVRRRNEQIDEAVGGAIRTRGSTLRTSRRILLSSEEASQRLASLGVCGILVVPSAWVEPWVSWVRS